VLISLLAVVTAACFVFWPDNKRPEQSRETQEEWLATVQSRITSHAKEYGWTVANIPLKKGISLEGASLDDPPPNHQKEVHQYQTPEGFLGIFVYLKDGRVNSAHLFYFFSHSEGVSDLQQKFRPRTPLSIRGGTAMEGWLRGARDPWE
jgi:hypothetical protein